MYAIVLHTQKSRHRQNVMSYLLFLLFQLCLDLDVSEKKIQCRNFFISHIIFAGLDF